MAAPYMTTSNVTYTYIKSTTRCINSSAVSSAPHARLKRWLIKLWGKKDTYSVVNFKPYDKKSSLTQCTVKHACTEILIKPHDRLPYLGPGRAMPGTHSGRRTGMGWRGSEGEVGRWCVQVEGWVWHKVPAPVQPPPQVRVPPAPCGRCLPGLWAETLNAIQAGWKDGWVGDGGGGGMQKNRLETVRKETKRQ